MATSNKYFTKRATGKPCRGVEKKKTGMKLSTAAFSFLLIFLLSGLSSCHKDKMTVPPVNTTPAWTRINSLPPDRFSLLEIANGVIYTASITTNTIYISTDNGTNWTASAPLSPTVDLSALTVFKNKIFVGTYLDDVYSSSNQGKSWVDGDYLPQAYSFAEWNNNLYCGSYYSGIMVLDTLTGKWRPFSSGFHPATNYFYVSKIAVINNSLIAAVDMTDKLATYDINQQTWIQQDYLNVPKGDFYVSDIIYNQGQILAATYDRNTGKQGIINTDNINSAWLPDTVGLKAGQKNTLPAITAGVNNYYAAIDVAPTGTWVYHRDKTLPAGSTWATGQEFLSSVHAYAIRESAHKLFLATDHGIYYRNM